MDPDLDEADIKNRINDKAESGGFASLTGDERIVYLVSWAEFEVSLASTKDYLAGATGDLAGLLSGAFDRLGCPKMAKAAQEIISQLDLICPLDDRSRREMALYSPPAGLSESMNEFTRMIDQGEDGYRVKLDQFIRDRWL